MEGFWNIFQAFSVVLVIGGTPLLFATLGELLTEKAGHLNLGVEGMMLIGAVAGFAAGHFTGSPLLAMGGAFLAGGLGAMIYGFLTVTLRANQVVSGLALTMFGTGISSYLGVNFIGQKMSAEISAFFSPVAIPLLSSIPYVGRVFFRQDPMVYLGYVTVALLGTYLYRTRIGLNLRAVGENPGAADASGINVDLYKYVHIFLGGALCGLGGAYLSVVAVPQWQDGITAGRGWIAIALVIFAGWNPFKAILGAYLFGGLSIIGFYFGNYFSAWNISQNLIDMLPYAVTILVLTASSVRKSKEKGAPKALGVAYYREER
ncbi:ABC transporter permease [Anaerotalea alkaliphila]|uniref:ABC transporter permease n=1 Tax=Anaerotalea alkaliphila TaxID=2662126 RepID=A0A7X5KM23_9FIRM|nr:ABC transporter permease [Anaerotalea alkaliphila]NDL67339.1 ABC transporter permease [Anaerotalea alkaliphila]